MPAFEYDPHKSDSNKAKHGIDFTEAQRLWDDPYLAEMPARREREDRSICIGLMKQRHWSAIVTYRGGNVRLVSVRRSRKQEVAFYESNRARQKI